MKTVPQTVWNIILRDEDKVQDGNNQSGNMIWYEEGRKNVGGNGGGGAKQATLQDRQTEGLGC